MSCAQSFAAGNKVILIGMGLHAGTDLLKRSAYIKRNIERLCDLAVTRFNHLKYAFMIYAIFDVRIAEVEKIGDFIVAFFTLAWRAHNNDAPRIVRAMMSRTAEKCSASARELPPNFTVLSITGSVPLSNKIIYDSSEASPAANTLSCAARRA